MIYEIINPSDAVCLSSDNSAMAGIAVMMMSQWYGLNDADGKEVLPIFAGEKWLTEQGITDVNNYIKVNAVKLAEIFESVFYGKPRDKEMFDKALEKMTPENAEAYKKEWNDKRRSSMTNIEECCLNNAKALRKL